jgi:hypothetical protein
MPANISQPEAHILMNCFYVTYFSLFSANRASIIKREEHIPDIRECFKKHSRQFILRRWEQAPPKVSPPYRGGGV